jgi:FkbM family methyltransferase
MRYMLRKFIAFLFKLIGSRVPRNLLLTRVGYESLSSYEKFLADGGNELLHSDLPLKNDSIAVILGAYLGDSCQVLNDMYSCRIIAVEPVKDYVISLENRFKHITNVQILPFAASDSTGSMEINVMDDASSQIRSIGDLSKVEIIQARDVVNLVELDKNEIAFIEINIEGAEYSVIRRIIEAQVMKNIHTILVQFHNFDLDSELLRAQIRQSLRETHILRFNYDFVWEKWERI